MVLTENNSHHPAHTQAQLKIKNNFKLLGDE